MASKASEWKDGKEIWVVTHDSERADKHLDVRGDVPPQFAGIRDRLLAAQASEAGRQRAVSGARIEKGAGVIRVTVRSKSREPQAESQPDPGNVEALLGSDRIFDIPVETAASLTGFSHDRARDYLAFEVLERISLFQRLFGR